MAITAPVFHNLNHLHVLKLESLSYSTVFFFKNFLTFWPMWQDDLVSIFKET